MVILGIVLVLTGAGLMVAEAHLPTYGVLGLAGVASLVAGGPSRSTPPAAGRRSCSRSSSSPHRGRSRSRPSCAAPRASRDAPRTGAEALVGHVGVVRHELAPVGQVFVDGALWRARAAGTGRGRAGLREGDHVVVERSRA